MAESGITEATLHLIDQVLIWVGFGTIVGLVAKAIMPGRDPGGAVATLMMGIAGTIIGCAVLMYATGGHHVSPISPLGFLVGTAGAFVILFFYKLLSGRIINENGHAVRAPYFRVLSRRRQPRQQVIVDDSHPL